MTEDLLYFKQINPGFDQMGCIAVTQAVGADLFFRPQAVATWRRVVCTPPRSSGVVAAAALFNPP